jgi:NAD(P)-dependent dehydrogenase (short-subunit alcohol dehydrogenase family)
LVDVPRELAEIKTAVVTGASRGIGRAIAIALAKEGARTLVHYRRSRPEAEAVVAQIREAGGQAEAVQVDLAAADGPQTLAQQARDLLGDRLDILVANAGICRPATLERTTLESFDAHFAVNVRAPFFLVQQLLPVLQSGSSVTFISSMSARAASDMLAAYAASKGAVETLVKQLAFTLGPRGIRVNAVAPGIVETDMSRLSLRTEVGRKETLATQALKHIGQPEHIASIVAFLASEAAAWVTGDIVRVDGGSRL